PQLASTNLPSRPPTFQQHHTPSLYFNQHSIPKSFLPSFLPLPPTFSIQYILSKISPFLPTYFNIQSAHHRCSRRFRAFTPKRVKFIQKHTTNAVVFPHFFKKIRFFVHISRVFGT
ncbi:MAG: hypothetical protein ACYS1A_15610, partial [Planctomycetota bacterium]